MEQEGEKPPLKVIELQKQMVEKGHAVSKYDFSYRGRRFELEIRPCCQQGLTLIYFMREKIVPDSLGLPERMKQLVERGLIAQHPCHRKWWDILLRRTLETKALRDIKRLQKQVRIAVDHLDRLNAVKERLK